MPNRIIREGILTSDRVNALSVPAELFYRRLMSVVDDYGRFDARPVMLKISCFPLRVDSVREADIPRWIAECEKAGLIALYAVDGKPYLEMTDFRQAVRAKHSKYPAPSSATHVLCTCKQMPCTCIASAPVVEDEDEDEGGRRKTARKRPLPDGFGISPGVRAWAEKNGHDRLEQHLEHFVGYARAHAKTYGDWDQALQNAIRDNWAKLPPSTGGGRRVAL